MFCKICKTLNSTLANHCIRCGHQLSLSCPKCSHANPYDSNFCERCGEIFFAENLNDNDGNEYRTICIGTQIWTAENWRCTKNNQGVPLHIIPKNVWESLSDTESLIYYPNNEYNNVSEVGFLYNWHAAQQLAPNGWHLPTKEDFEELLKFCRKNFVNQRSNDFHDIAKSLASRDEDNGHCWWKGGEFEGNIGFDTLENNMSGFNAKPAGCHGYDDTKTRYDDTKTKYHYHHREFFNEIASFWSSTKERSEAFALSLHYSSSRPWERYENMKLAFSVRLIRNG